MCTFQLTSAFRARNNLLLLVQQSIQWEIITFQYKSLFIAQNSSMLRLHDSFKVKRIFAFPIFAQASLQPNFNQICASQFCLKTKCEIIKPSLILFDLMNGNLSMFPSKRWRALFNSSINILKLNSEYGILNQHQFRGQPAINCFQLAQPGRFRYTIIPVGNV